MTTSGSKDRWKLGKCKLTKRQVEEIKFLIDSQVVQHKDIAEMYGVSRATISRIKYGDQRSATSS
jgi:predicted XRE-type DNA-binding protein